MREEIEVTEFANRERLGNAIIAPAEEVDPQRDPGLPPTLPRPEYATRPGVIGRDDAEVDFYVSCKAGRQDEVREYVQDNQPPNIVRQYGLEKACFADQPAVARYLLENGTALHRNVFMHPHDITKSQYLKDHVKTRSIFDGLDRSRHIIALLDVFLDAGWHPSPPRLSPKVGSGPWVLSAICGSKPLIEFLLERLPNLRFDPGDAVIASAIGTWDTELLDRLLLHGADPTVGAPLFSVAVANPFEPGNRGPWIPFSRRRATAEWLLRHGASVNEVRKMPCRDLRPHRPQPEDGTALTIAYASADEEFVYWLLENGADRKMQGPEWGRNDPRVARELVERVRARHGGRLLSERGPGD